MAKFLDGAGLKQVWLKIQQKFTTKDDFDTEVAKLKSDIENKTTDAYSNIKVKKDGGITDIPAEGPTDLTLVQGDNITLVPNSSDRTLTIIGPTAEDMEIPPASATVAGTMSPEHYVKFENLPADAQKNIINSIKVNGTALKPDTDGTVEIDTISEEEVDNKISAASTTINETIANTKTSLESQIDSKISGVYRYKGSVADYADLEAITKKEEGDVYNVEGGNPAGTNYAWTGTSWDALGGSFTIEALSTEDIDAIYYDVFPEVTTPEGE